MAFTFNLGGDDIDPEDESMEAHYSSEDVLTSEPNSPVPPTRCYYIGETDSESESTRFLLNCLPSRISFESVAIPVDHKPNPPGARVESSAQGSGASTQDMVVLRRPIYDVLLQLKAEANSEENNNAQLISALESNDRQSGLYEGGLKTWEGALDLAKFVEQMNFQTNGEGWHIVELGAGSALPSVVALTRILMGTRQTKAADVGARFHLTLSDYNDEVLRFSTWANVLLASETELDRRRRLPLDDETDSLEVNEDLVRDCRRLWQNKGVSFNFISGPWGKDFEDASMDLLVSRQPNLLILASETIYDLNSLPVFTDTLVGLLRRHGRQSRAWVAAKKLYFGVGGGVDAFVQEVEARGGAVAEIMNIKEGVSRVVLEVTVTERP